MQLSIYQIDAFAEQVFEGNPAAVVPLENWLPDDLMQKIAAENNLAETAFFIPSQDEGHLGDYHIRWFTPTTEADLCGHATLASAYVLFTELGYEPDSVNFNSLSGWLSVAKSEQGLTLDFPSQPPQECLTPQALVAGLGAAPKQCFAAMDYLAVFESENEVRALKPNHIELSKADLRCVIAVAPGDKDDLVVRVFAPKVGIPEDPVTGSAYTLVMPYWAALTGKTTLNARQVSERSGKVYCELVGDRVKISGQAVKYLEGTIVV